METATAAHLEGQPASAPVNLVCRSCGTPLSCVFVDLGSSPLANSYLTAEDLEKPEVFYPLRVYVCDQCFLVQLPCAVTPQEIFSDYAYLSSYSDSWVRPRRRVRSERHRAVRPRHAQQGRRDREQRRLPAPELQGRAESRSSGSSRRGTPPRSPRRRASDRWSSSSGRQRPASSPAARRGADLLIGNNVLAHVPDLNDFVDGHRRVARARPASRPWSSRTCSG